MEMRHRHEYTVQFTVEFVGARRRRTLSGIQEVPYIFEAVDSGNICETCIVAKNPIRAKAMAEKKINENCRALVNYLARKTINQRPDAVICAKGPDGNWRSSKTFYSIKGYRIKELIIK